jgi:hypothetical protein
MKKISLGMALATIDNQNLIIKNLTKKLEDRDKELSQIAIKQLQGSADEGERKEKAINMIKNIRAKKIKKISRVAMSEKFGLTLGSINSLCAKVSNNEA